MTEDHDETADIPNIVTDEDGSDEERTESPGADDLAGFTASVDEGDLVGARIARNTKQIQRAKTVRLIFRWLAIVGVFGAIALRLAGVERAVWIPCLLVGVGAMYGYRLSGGTTRGTARWLSESERERLRD